MEKYLRVNLLGPGPRLMKKEFNGPRSHKILRNTDLEVLRNVPQNFRIPESNVRKKEY